MRFNNNGAGTASLTPHVILDGLHTLDAACNFDCLAHVGPGTDEAAQFNHTLESFYIDFGRLQSGFVEYRRLGLGGDNAVVKIFTGTLLC